MIRCGEHSDYGTVTFLFQDDLGGLEVKSGERWIEATPIKGSIVVGVQIERESLMKAPSKSLFCQQLLEYRDEW